MDLEQCKAKFANETGQSQFTYEQCVQQCGGGVGEFKWTMFSQDFSTWLLPWFALMFQLPFGASGTQSPVDVYEQGLLMKSLRSY